MKQKEQSKCTSLYKDKLTYLLDEKVFPSTKPEKYEFPLINISTIKKLTSRTVSVNDEHLVISTSSPETSSQSDYHHPLHFTTHSPVILLDYRLHLTTHLQVSIDLYRSVQTSIGLYRPLQVSIDLFTFIQVSIDLYRFIQVSIGPPSLSINSYTITQKQTQK